MVEKAGSCFNILKMSATLQEGHTGFLGLMSPGSFKVLCFENRIRPISDELGKSRRNKDMCADLSAPCCLSCIGFLCNLPWASLGLPCEI